LAWLQWRVNQDTVTPLAVANPDGTAGRALIVYQPGLSSFPERVASAFASGLAAAGWQVSTTTASRQAPAAVTGYDLIVLGSPVYGGAPAKPLDRYIERVGDFRGKPVVILLTAAGDAGPAIKLTEQKVARAGGRPLRSLGLTTMKPNDEGNKYSGSNTDRAVQIARAAGQALQLSTP
jgi:flavorubredoxin